MIEKRIIPVLLIQNRGLVKTIRFKKPVYVGDPINAVKIFNNKYIDELIIADIDASRQKNSPNNELLKDIASECFVPMTYAGGITDIDQMEKIYRMGFEKVVIDTTLHLNPNIILEAVKKFGSQSVVGGITLHTDIFGKKIIYNYVKKQKIKVLVTEHIKYIQDLGVGEVFINDASRDGMMNGYDTNFISKIQENITVPLTICGGAGSLKDVSLLFNKTRATGAAAGSIFVFASKSKGVLINYPDRSECKPIIKI